MRDAYTLHPLLLFQLAFLPLCLSTPAIYTRVSVRPTCIINVAQFVRGQAWIRVPIPLEGTPDFAKNVAPRRGFRPFGSYKVHKRGGVGVRVYDSCRAQGFGSLLVAITVARRAGIIALIVLGPCWCWSLRAGVCTQARAPWTRE